MMALMDFKMLKLLKKWVSILFSNITVYEDLNVIPLIPAKKRGRKKKIRVIEPETQKEM